MSWDTCLTCGFPIAPQNLTIGYGGQLCVCPANPAQFYRRPSSHEPSFGQREEQSKIGALKMELEMAHQALSESNQFIYNLGVKDGELQKRLDILVDALTKIAEGPKSFRGTGQTRHVIEAYAKEAREALEKAKIKITGRFQ